MQMGNQNDWGEALNNINPKNIVYLNTECRTWDCILWQKKDTYLHIIILGNHFYIWMN